MLIESFHFGDDVSCYWRICLIMAIRKKCSDRSSSVYVSLMDWTGHWTNVFKQYGSFRKFVFAHHRSHDFVKWTLCQWFFREVVVALMHVWQLICPSMSDPQQGPTDTSSEIDAMCVCVWDFRCDVNDVESSSWFWQNDRWKTCITLHHCMQNSNTFDLNGLPSHWILALIYMEKLCRITADPSFCAFCIINVTMWINVKCSHSAQILTAVLAHQVICEPSLTVSGIFGLSCSSVLGFEDVSTNRAWTDTKWRWSGFDCWTNPEQRWFKG